jgi:homoserine O-acetyltransferase
VAQAADPIFLRPAAQGDTDRGHAMNFDGQHPLALDCGRVLSPFSIAYVSYGTLNAARSNTVLVCHALTGDQFAASKHPITGKPGWWETMVGPGKPIDTNRFFVLCTNVIGGCMGSTGPASINPENGQPFGLDFPVVTIRDMVRAQAMLLDALGIKNLLCATGGSMGGMQALQWAALYPERVISAIPIASAARHTAQNIAFHEVGRQAIMGDPRWNGGKYGGAQPIQGLAVARMVGHITYLSEGALERKFGRELQDRAAISFGFGPDFQVESYLHHQGASFVERFDANSYLYITRAMDYFDLVADYNGELSTAFRKSITRFCVISFTSDWLFPTAENLRIANALPPANVLFKAIETDKGHDAFLLDEPELLVTVRDFLNETAALRAIA